MTQPGHPLSEELRVRAPARPSAERGGLFVLSDFVRQTSNPGGEVHDVGVSRDVGLATDCLRERDVEVVSKCVGVAAVDYPVLAAPLNHHVTAVGQC